MDRKVLKRQSNRRIFIYFLTIFVTLMLTSSLVFLYIENNINTSDRMSLVTEQLIETRTLASRVANNISLAVDDLEYIKKQILAKHNGDLTEEEIILNWKYYADTKKIYDQIRYIDANGMEKMRVNYIEGASFCVPKEELQNKKERYYFSDVANLRDGQIYVSVFDLNVENGKIEEPIKPMIRFGTPLYIDGEFLGVVVLNYKGNHILDVLIADDQKSSDTIMLLNNDGYWLYGGEGSNWAFMYDERKNNSFANLYTEVWKEMTEHDGNYRNDEGLYTYSKIILEENLIDDKFVLGSGNWSIVSFVSANDEDYYFLKDQIWIVMFRIFDSNRLMYILVGLIAFLGASLLNKNREAYNRIKYLSEYDGFTGIFNRREGLYRLENKMDNAKDSAVTSIVSFIDINGLKQVNDHLGHSAGDELILTVVDVINQHLGDDSIFMRLGGDEFLVYMPFTDEDAGHHVFNLIKESFKKINEYEDRAYNISISYGLMTVSGKSYDDMEELIKIADEHMYIYKKENRKNAVILKEN